VTKIAIAENTVELGREIVERDGDDRPGAIGRQAATPRTETDDAPVETIAK